MRKHWPALTVFVLLVAAYALLTFLLPINAETLTRYDLTPAAARTLRLSIALPLIVIWVITMYGYIRFKNYAVSIENGHDGKALSRIADGILVLALWLPFSSLLTNSVGYLYRRYPDLTSELIITRNYITLLALFGIVYLIWKGSQQLLGAAKIKLRSIKFDKLNVLTLVLSLIFAYFVLFDPAKSTPLGPGTVAAYYLPDWLLVLTVIVPYGLVWFFGIRAIANMEIYTRRVKGVIYKSAVGYIAMGLGTSIVSLLLIRYLASMTAWLNSLTLKPLLALLYVLVFVIGIGAALLAIGAKKLQKIEEV